MAKAKPPEQPPEQPSTDLVPAHLDVSPVAERLIGGVGSYWTSLDTGTMQGKAFLQRALVTQDLKVDEIDDGVITVTDLVAQRIQIVSDNDGEIADATRLVLIGKDGRTVSTVSEGAVNSLRQVISTFGKPPWKDGLRLKFERKKTRKGFWTFCVTVDPTQFKE